MSKSNVGDMVNQGVTILGLIQKAKEEGIDKEEYNEMMEKGLSDKQKQVAENRSGEGRIRLTGKLPQTDDGGVTIPTTLEKLADGKKKPWIVELDGVEFVVKTSIGEGSYPHSRWSWREDGFRFVFYKSRTEDTVHSLEIIEDT